MKPRKSVIYVPEYMYLQEFQVRIEESSFVGRQFLQMQIHEKKSI